MVAIIFSSTVGGEFTRKPLLAEASYPYCDWFISLNKEKVIFEL